MSSGFGELTDQAHHLVSSGDLAGAQQLLSDALTDADPRPANATPELAEAASLQARVLIALGEPHSARGWAAFAYAATTRLHGRADPRTVAAAATLAAVLHRVGSHSRAARLYQEVIIELTAQDGPESLRVLAAHADLATVEYARGQCTVARDRLQDAWDLHREVYGDGHPSGIKMLARLGAMQRDCGQFAEAHDNLALARELCRQHLPADDPLATQVAALARAAANPDHVCADNPPTARDTPVVPAARVAPHDDGPTDSGHHPSAAAPHHAGAVPNPRLPSDEAIGSTGGRWPTEPVDGPPPHTADPPVPPSVVGLAGGAQEQPGVYRLYRPADSFPSPDSYPPPDQHAPPDSSSRSEPYAPVEPYTPSRLLPVPVHRAPPEQRNRLVPVLVAGVVVVLLGAAAVIAGVARVDGDDEPTPPPASASPTAGAPASTAPAPGGSAPTSAAAAASPGTPPTAVTLRDNRDSIALNWTYPAGSEGPVVIAGGRTGQTHNIFATLPAGTTSFVIYALNRTNDFCFTVAVAWSTDTVAQSKQVCTRRR
ncbi:tetratricopeptide repeat protein [Micromonospora parva]|uniref:tetratricopeptide repeat protein n=1 Tax=Micromonospora parva TaxID=1464048 RepID=UPI0033ECD24A